MRSFKRVRAAQTVGVISGGVGGVRLKHTECRLDFAAVVYSLALRTRVTDHALQASTSVHAWQHLAGVSACALEPSLLQCASLPLQWKQLPSSTWPGQESDAAIAAQAAASSDSSVRCMPVAS